MNHRGEQETIPPPVFILSYKLTRTGWFSNEAFVRKRVSNPDWNFWSKLVRLPWEYTMHLKTENTCPACQGPKFLPWFNCWICRQVSHSFCRSKTTTVTLGAWARGLSCLWNYSIWCGLSTMNWAKKQALAQWPSCWTAGNSTMTHGSTSIPQHFRRTSKRNLSKKLLLPSHPILTPVSKGCREAQSPLLCNRAVDTPVLSIHPFLKPPLCSTLVWTASASHWSAGTGIVMMASSKQSSSNKKKKNMIIFWILKSVSRSKSCFCTLCCMEWCRWFLAFTILPS